MGDPVVLSARVAPFESASELREANARLLEELDSHLEHDASATGEGAALARLESEIQQFLERGAATGIYLEEITERTSCQVLLDYWVSNLSGAGIQVAGVRLARFDRERLPDLKDKRSPYVGLDAFRDQAFFFGRETDTQALLAQVRGAPLVVVLGASGSGKSSLVMGGLLPAIEAMEGTPELLIVPPFVPGNVVLDHLADAVLRVRGVALGGARDVTARLRQDPSSLLSLVGGADASPTLITIDQFEEVFTLSDAADREALVANLVHLLEAGRGHHVILTMREEFRTRIVELRALSPYLDKAWYSMRPMGYEELKAAVEGPAALVNLQFQSGIADRLVKSVLGQPAVLPLLQFTLRSLWETRDRNRITREVYDRVGSPLNALKKSADRFYDGLAPQTQDEVKRILLELVWVDELLEAYRQPVPKSRLMQAGKANTEDVLDLLVANDYVRITADGSDGVVEVKHESLVRNWPRLVTWIDEKRHQRRQRLALSQAAEQWAQNGKPQQGLLTGWQLQAAESHSDLSELEKEFAQASSEAAGRMQREKETALRREAEQAKALAAEQAKSALRLRYLVFATAVIALILVGAALRAYMAARDRERFQQLAISSSNAIDEHLNQALLLGIEAIRMAPDQPEPQRRLLSALTSNPEFQLLLPAHDGAVRAVAFSPKTGKLLASASYDSTIILWDLTKRLMLHAPLRAHRDSVYRLAFSPDEKTLASAGNDGVCLWNVETGRLIGTLPHKDTVYSVAIARDGKTLASGGRDGTVRLWNIESKREEASLQHGKTPVFNVAFGPDGIDDEDEDEEGELLASGGQDGRIVLWNFKKLIQVGEPLEVNREVFSMAFSHDGKIIASGNQEGRVDLWDVSTRKFAGSPNPEHFRGVYGVAFSPDDAQLATASLDRAVYVLNVGNVQAPQQRLKGYAERFYSVDVAADGTVAAGTDNGMVVLWDLNAPSRLGQVLQASKAGSARLAFSGTTLVSASENKLLFWNKGKDDVWTITSQTEAGQPTIALMVLSPDGKWVVTVGDDNSVNLWDLAQRRVVTTLVKPTREETIVSAAFGADNRTLAVGVTTAKEKKAKNEIRLLNLPDGNVRKVLGAGGPDMVWALAFSPTEPLLASGGDSDTKIWDLATSKPVRSLDHTSVFSLVFSPDGKILASGGNDSEVRLWDVETGSLKGSPLAHHRAPVLSVEFSRSGKLLASASRDQTVLLWDVETQQKMMPPLEGHTDAVLSAAFSADGQQLASSDDGGGIILWEMSIAGAVSRACEIVGRNFTEDEWKYLDRIIGLRSWREWLFADGPPPSPVHRLRLQKPISLR
jgi:WD40 repeat protein